MSGSTTVNSRCGFLLDVILDTPLNFKRLITCTDSKTKTEILKFIISTGNMRVIYGKSEKGTKIERNGETEDTTMSIIYIICQRLTYQQKHVYHLSLTVVFIIDIYFSCFYQVSIEQLRTHFIINLGMCVGVCMCED